MPAPLRCLATLVTLALLCGSPTTALAQGRLEPTAAEAKQAKKLIKQAKRDKTLGDRHAKRKRTKKANAAYRKAALAYLEAYSLVEHDALIFRLAEVYEGRGEKDWALRGYKKYLAVAADGEHANRAKQRSQELTAEIARADILGSSDKGERDVELDPTAVFGFEGAEAEEDPVIEEEPEITDDTEIVFEDDDSEKKKKKKKKKRREAEQPGKMLRYGGMGTASVGALLLVIGIKYGLDARSASNTLSNSTDGWGQDDRDLIDEGNSAESKMMIFSLLGAATLAGGSVLYYYGMRADRNAREQRLRRRVHLTPQLTPTHAGLMVVGEF